MNTYVPLAVRYRPQKFCDVVGQDVTVKIITRGIQKNRLGSALLFSGTRGVGKTTIARILAKTFRCENRSADSPEPCCCCESCLSIDRQVDVIEIDAASNTGVDDIREIIESSRYRPTKGNLKIFIIDEVHMLSKSAFNALLKTLEEPPSHVKFLFATTETYKIPETIMSRVLKFDLNPIDDDLISQYLSSVCNRENIIANIDALRLIAKAANGSIRDSLSILDQAINVAEGNELTATDVKTMLNISDWRDIVDLLKFIFSSNIKSAIQKYRDIRKKSTSENKIIQSLLDYVYALTCIKSSVEPPEQIVSADILKDLQGIDISIASLSKIWQMLLKGLDELRLCECQNLGAEMLLIRMAYAAKLPDLLEIINNNISNISVQTPCVQVQSRAGSLAEEALKIFSNAKQVEM